MSRPHLPSPANMRCLWSCNDPARPEPGAHVDDAAIGRGRRRRRISAINCRTRSDLRTSVSAANGRHRELMVSATGIGLLRTHISGGVLGHFMEKASIGERLPKVRFRTARTLGRTDSDAEGQLISAVAALSIDARSKRGTQAHQSHHRRPALDRSAAVSATLDAAHLEACRCPTICTYG